MIVISGAEIKQSLYWNLIQVTAYDKLFYMILKLYKIDLYYIFAQKLHDIKSKFIFVDNMLQTHTHIYKALLKKYK